MKKILFSLSVLWGINFATTLFACEPPNFHIPGSFNTPDSGGQGDPGGATFF